jgi:hypothetical protein
VIIPQDIGQVHVVVAQMLFRATVRLYANQCGDMHVNIVNSLVKTNNRMKN